MAAADAEALRMKAEGEKAQLRERIRQQLNLILETRESARGLIVNISDVLFDFNKYTLKPGAREKMAKVSGILLAYPGLKIQVEGHTDSVGTDEYNQRLSEQRADTRCATTWSRRACQPGQSARLALARATRWRSNDTAAGRQQNRRVELVVSGEPIGIEGTMPTTGSPQAFNPPLNRSHRSRGAGVPCPSNPVSSRLSKHFQSKKLAGVLAKITHGVAQLTGHPVETLVGIRPREQRIRIHLIHRVESSTPPSDSNPRTGGQTAGTPPNEAPSGSAEESWAVVRNC